MPSYEALEVTREGSVAWLTLNPPHTLNAPNAIMVDELHDFLSRLDSDLLQRKR